MYRARAPRAGLREEVQELLPRALEVRVDPQLLPELGCAEPHRSTPPGARRASCSPIPRRRGHADEAVAELFNQLYDEVVTA